MTPPASDRGDLPRGQNENVVDCCKLMTRLFEEMSHRLYTARMESDQNILPVERVGSKPEFEDSVR